MTHPYSTSHVPLYELGSPLLRSLVGHTVPDLRYHTVMCTSDQVLPLGRRSCGVDMVSLRTASWLWRIQKVGVKDVIRLCTERNWSLTYLFREQAYERMLERRISRRFWGQSRAEVTF